MKLTSLISAAVVWTLASAKQLPIVIWHGLGDTYANEGLQDLARDLTAQLNVSTFLIHIADGAKEDQRATFFGKAAQEVEIAAEQIRNQPIFRDGYDAIGFSQGGQLLRALAQSFPDPPMRSLITLGSQHLGISQMAACQPRDFLCKSAEWLLRTGIWSGAAQGNLIPAQYYRNQASIAPYLINSGWLVGLSDLLVFAVSFTSLLFSVKSTTNDGEIRKLVAVKIILRTRVTSKATPAREIKH